MLRTIFPVMVLAALTCLANAQTNTSTQQQTVTPKVAPNSGTRERPAVLAMPAPDAETASAVFKRSNGSLMRAAALAPDPQRGNPALKALSPFAVPEPEPKLVRKHDLITIIIREESESSSQGTSDLKRNSELEARVDEFIKLNVANFAVQPGVTGTPPAIKLSGTRNFKGEATVDRTDSFIARITAEVVDVKPNGTLVLQARKKIKHDEEEQTYICSGVCRVEDLTPDNTILSTQLFDLEVSKTNKGQVRNTTRTSLLGKLLDFLNPF